MRRKKIKRISSVKLDLKCNFHQFRLASKIYSSTGEVQENHDEKKRIKKYNYL